MTDDGQEPGVAVSREQLAVLAAWAPRLAGLETAGAWRGGDADADGVIQMPWFERSPELEAFTDAMAGAAFVRPVDWPAWASSPEARPLIDDPARIAEATPAQLVYLLTTIVRGERFSDGQIEGAFQRGTLLAIARRAEALLAAS